MTTVDMMQHQEALGAERYSEHATYLHMTMQFEPLALDLLFEDFADVSSRPRNKRMMEKRRELVKTHDKMQAMKQKIEKAKMHAIENTTAPQKQLASQDVLSNGLSGEKNRSPATGKASR